VDSPRSKAPSVACIGEQTGCVGGRESEIVCATSSWSRAVSPVRNRASGRLVSVPALTSRGRNERGAERSERERERERTRLVAFSLAPRTLRYSTVDHPPPPLPITTVLTLHQYSRSLDTHSLTRHLPPTTLRLGQLTFIRQRPAHTDLHIRRKGVTAASETRIPSNSNPTPRIDPSALFRPTVRGHPSE
jgi:hypothetical protein